MSWDEVRAFALQYQPYLGDKWPGYVAEMEDIAQGAGVMYVDVLALNVRTEIAFGAFSDSCTALSWKRKTKSILAQNWDWNTEQAENLISLKIKKDSGLQIHMITEAGIIGKIGTNSYGVGCTLNAIKAKGVSYTKLPCHLALRTVMESKSRKDAIATLEKEGVASACHILVADATGGTGVECSSVDVVRLEMDGATKGEGVVTHTNHYLLPHHASVIEISDWLPDTHFRLNRIGTLLANARAKGEEPSEQRIEGWLKDEEVGDGASICRSEKSEGGLGLATLFGIVMDLGERKGKVLVGRPVDEGEVILMGFW